MHRFRWAFGGLLFVITLINFSDRAVIAVLGPVITKVFHLNALQWGIILSAFAWGYVPFVLVGGILADRFGAKRVFITAAVLWSVFLAAVTFAASFAAFVALRVLFGTAEGANHPNASRFVSRHFPKTESAFAMALVGAGITLGSGAVIAPIATLMASVFDWRAPLYLLAGLGVIWAALWAVLATDDPRDNPRFSTTELALIERERAESSDESDRSSWARILSSRTIWGNGIAFFTSAYGGYFMLTWFPSYLAMSRGLSLKAIGIATIFPWVAATIGMLGSGALSGLLYRKTRNLRIARSFFAGASLICGAVCVLGGFFTHSVTSAIALLTLANTFVYLGQPIYLSIPIDTFPDCPGKAAGLSIMLASSAGILAPLITGWIVYATGSFLGAFGLAATIFVLGALVMFALVSPEEHGRRMTEHAPMPPRPVQAGLR